jgi:hypothetical protein
VLSYSFFFFLSLFVSSTLRGTVFHITPAGHRYINKQGAEDQERNELISLCFARVMSCTFKPYRFLSAGTSTLSFRVITCSTIVSLSFNNIYVNYFVCSF